jgi:hypothetical protein
LEYFTFISHFWENFSLNRCWSVFNSVNDRCIKKIESCIDFITYVFLWFLYKSFNTEIGSSIILKSSLEKELFLRERLSICQHHDAVAGTAKELVSEDYIKMLKDSNNKIRESMGEIFEFTQRKVRFTYGN